MQPPTPSPEPTDPTHPQGTSPAQPSGASGGAPGGPTDGSQSQAHAAPADLPFFYYTQDEDDSSAAQSATSSSSFAHPFQPSIELPPLTPGAAPAQSTTMPAVPSAPGPSPSARSLFSSLRTAWLLGLLMLVLVLGGVLALARGAPPATPRPSAPVVATRTLPSTPTSVSPSKGGNAGHTSPTPTPTPHVPGTGAGNGAVLFLPSSQQTLDHLGWTQAGLGRDDEVEAYRVALTFTDREMSEDYRNIGTLTHHGGTMTAATFLLTPGAQHRFVTNDVRMINNVLYQKILNEQLIQQVLPETPTLVAFRQLLTQQGLRPMATISVPFELWQSRLDPATGQRVSGIERDGTTQQPLIHHMTVLLLRVPPQQQGPDAPMGGAGWLVNNYALDSTAPLEVATAPSL